MGSPEVTSLPTAKVFPFSCVIKNSENINLIKYSVFPSLQKVFNFLFIFYFEIHFLKTTILNFFSVCAETFSRSQQSWYNNNSTCHDNVHGGGGTSDPDQSAPNHKWHGY
jgi:hypothetical protein